MPDSSLHFAQPLWLWGLVLIPVVLAWLKLSSPFRRHSLEERYADPELLPHLTGIATTGTVTNRRPAIIWGLAWVLLLLAMAGPRWGFRHINPFEPGVDLVILLDISTSMNVTDVAPSRLLRARQEIQDLVQSAQGIRIGLIAFATIAHVVTPITNDSDALLRQLPMLSTDLVRLQGSRLAGALVRAEQLLSSSESDSAANILLISDGDFTEADLEQKIETLRNKGIRLHVLAVGSSDGGLVPNVPGSNGEPVLSRLEDERLRQLSEAGGGIFQLADYRDNDSKSILKTIQAQAKARQDTNLKTLVWNNYFFWLLLPAVLVLLILSRTER